MKTESSMPILVLEDSDEDFDTLREALEGTGLDHKIRRATSGDDCLGLLRDGRPDTWPALVLLDLNTTALDRRDVLREIKTDPALRMLPVVILSTSANPRDRELCYDRGANAYHVKPLMYPQHLGVLSGVFNYWLRSVELPERPRQGAGA